jgi:alkylation response protein AidB-like acyl-CoA dehydrogenase
MTNYDSMSGDGELSAVQNYAQTQAALAADYLERAQSIAPFVEREAGETERLSMITPTVHDAFSANNLYWMSIPQELGGPALGPTAAMPVIEEITRADGSSGWSLMANAFNNAMAAGYMPDEGAHLLWGGEKKLNTCGQFAAVGQGTESSDGVTGGGRFRFGSGCGHTNWMGGGVVLHKDGKPVLREDGTPETRVLHVPRENVKLCGGWDVIGLVGTASFDYEIPEQLVPAHLVFDGDPMAPPVRGGPLHYVGWFGIGAAGHSAVALGIARRALEEVARIVYKKRRLGYAVDVSDHPVFLHQFAQSDAAFWSARSQVMNAFSSMEQTVVAGGEISAEQMSRLRQACSLAHKMAGEVVQFCHHWGASESFRNPTVLGRCTRDLAVATQHVIADEGAWSDCAGPIYESWLREDAQ